MQTWEKSATSLPRLVNTPKHLLYMESAMCSPGHRFIFTNILGNSQKLSPILRKVLRFSRYYRRFPLLRTFLRASKKLTKDYFLPLKWFRHPFFLLHQLFLFLYIPHQKISSFPSNILLSLRILGSRFNLADLSKTMYSCKAVQIFRDVQFSLRELSK